ncbi:strawberry notch C-terminal domain-containing protein [Acinetobacter gandensis]|uniref:strawberry notch C-terminal domain-containing protein n=1 Tax=Acinetobacter gandensis TaxID=1443941 RepID=UPI0039898B4F
MATNDLNEKIKWLDLSQAGVYLDVRRVGQNDSQLLLLDIQKKLSKDNLSNLGFSPLQFEDYPHFDGHLYQYTMNETLKPRLFHEQLGIPVEFIRNIYATRQELHDLFNQQAKLLVPQRLDVALNSSTPLGYNSDGNRIFASSYNRFYLNSQGTQIPEGPNDQPSSLYLRAAKYKDLKECLRGYVYQLEIENKSHTHNDFLKFLALITQAKNADVDISKVSDKQIHMAEEALETVLVERLGEMEFDSSSFNTALALYNRMPTKTMRNNTIRMLQQYSTPIPMSLVAQRLLIEGDNRTKQNYSVLEPTVGNGSLIGLLSREQNASIFAVELDPKRADRTKSLTQNFECTVITADATQLDFEQAFKQKVDYVIANPPFGAMDSLMRVAQIRVQQRNGVDPEPKLIQASENVWFSTDKLDHAIIIKSLNARNDLGRSVFIIGADKQISDGTLEKKSKNLFNYLHKHYQVEGAVEIHGSAYARNGANQNVRMIVVGDRKNEQELLDTYQSSIVPEKLKLISDYDELWDWSNNVIYNRLNPTKDLYFNSPINSPIQESKLEPSPTVPEPNTPSDDNDDLLSGLGDDQPVSQLQNIASTVNQTSAVSMFDADVEKKQEELKEQEAKKPSFGKKKKANKKVEFDFGTVEVNETSTSSAVDDVPQTTEVTPTFDNPNDSDLDPDAIVNDDGQPTADPGNNEENEENLDTESSADDHKDLNQSEDPELPVEPVIPLNLNDEESIDLGNIANAQNTNELQPIVQVPNADNSNEPKDENIYQVKYIPMSKASEPIALVPKNQVRAINQANSLLLNYIDNISEQSSVNYTAQVENGDYPTIVDAYVAHKLQYENFDALKSAYACEQVDAVAHVILRFDQNMPVLIGDQTGLGKGRVAAASLRYSAIRGVAPVFLTDTTQLLNDIWRDIVATDSDKFFQNPFIFNSDAIINRFGTEEVLFRGQDIPRDLTAIPAQHDLVLGTYSQFNRPNRKRALLTNFINQNTILVFDEAHRAASLKSATSQFFLDVIEQTNLINFQSATGIKRPENLEFFHKLFPESVTRTDLQKVIENADGPILEFISEGLVDSSAMIRREQDLSHIDIKTYVPNEVEIKKYHNFSDVLSDILADMVKFSKDIRHDALENIASDFDANAQLQFSQDSDDPENRLSLSIMNFGSRMYQIQKQFLLALKTDSTCDAVINALNEGRKPVIGLENTGESLFNILMQERLESLMKANTAQDVLADSPEKEKQFNTFKSVSAEIEFLENELQALMVKEERDSGDEKAAKKLQKELNKLEDQRSAYLQDQISVLDQLPQFRDLLGVMLDRIDIVKAQDNYGNSFIKKLSNEIRIDEAGNEIPSPYKAVLDRIRDKIDQFPDLPLMPLDVIRNKVTKAGFKIDEISGRSVFLTEMSNGKWQVNKQVNNNTQGKILVQSKFQSGELDATIVTRSGCTGISLHAAKNPDPTIPSDHLRQRELFFLQKPENSTDTIQMIGRVGRRGEVSHPIMTTIDSGIPAETRMHLMMMRKLSTLSANVSANAETKFNENDYPDMLNFIGNRVALDYLKNNVNLANTLDINIEDDEKSYSHRTAQNYHVNQLLSKLILMPINQQEQVYQDLVVDYNDKIRELDLLGRNPLKTNFLDWKAKTIRDFQIKDNFFTLTSESDAAKINTFDLPVRFEGLRYIEHVEPLRSENLRLMFKESDDYLKRQFQRINQNINETVHGLIHYTYNFEALMFQKYEGFARQKLFNKKGELRSDLLKPHEEMIFKHFGIDRDSITNFADIQFRAPDDHTSTGFQKVAEAVYLANDEILTSNFERMYRMVLDLKHFSRSMAQNESNGHTAHGILFQIPKPTLFEDDVAPEHRIGALLRLDLPPLRLTAITPNAIKMDLVYPGDKKSFKVPLIKYSMDNSDPDINFIVPVSDVGKDFLKSHNKDFYSNASRVQQQLANRQILPHLLSDDVSFAKHTRKNFENAPSGDVTRQAITLTGNMFKAHKIVSSLDIRYSTVIFTDADGMRNRALLLPSNTPTNIFEDSLENQVTFKQVNDISNFLNNLSDSTEFSRSNYAGTKIEFPYKKAKITFYFNGHDGYGVTVQSVSKQLSKLMGNTNLFSDPRNPNNPSSLNINFTEPARNEFRFPLKLDQVSDFIKELDTTTKIETAFLNLKSKEPKGVDYFMTEVGKPTLDKEIKNSAVSLEIGIKKPIKNQDEHALIF